MSGWVLAHLKPWTMNSWTDYNMVISRGSVISISNELEGTFAAGLCVFFRFD